MSEFMSTCSRCCGEVVFPAQVNVINCPYCGRLLQRPRSTGRLHEALQRGNRLLKQCQFEEAAECFRLVLAQNPDEHDALWGRLMCRYGVEVAEETLHGQTRRYLLCHRARRSSIRNERDFRDACDLAAPAVRAQYEQDAQYIDNIQAKIRQKAARAEQYDVFICYKETDPVTRERTEDSLIAQRLYNRYIHDGYRVFFARETLKGKYGEDYEAAIYQGIATAQVMLVVGLKPEHFRAVWPRSEWMRYLERVEENDALLIPVYGGMEAEDLPEEFLNLHLHGCCMDDDYDFIENIESTLYRRIREQKEGKPSAPVATLTPATPPTPPQSAPVAAPAPEGYGCLTAKDAASLSNMDFSELVAADIVRLHTSFDKQEYERRSQEPAYVRGCNAILARDFKTAREALTQAYIGGNYYALTLLGETLYFGNDCEKDYNLALKYFIVAASHGCPLALAWTTEFFRMGRAVARNRTGTKRIFNAARNDLELMADCGSAFAAYFLGFDLIYDRYESDEVELGLYYLEKACDAGLHSAAMTLASCYLHGDGVPENNDEAFRLLEAYPVPDSGKYNWLLGLCHYWGAGTEEDDDMAFSYFRDSARQGFANGKHRLAECYYNGYGTEADYAKAAKWYQDAADNSPSSDAAYMIGTMYLEGKGVAQDVSNGLRYLQKAAEAGHWAACRTLGEKYLTGEHVQQNIEMGCQWLEKAAEDGDPEAQAMLGHHYLRTNDHEDRAKAFHWLLEAANQNDPESMYQVARCYEHATGVQHDADKALKWYKSASDMAHGKAMAELARLYLKEHQHYDEAFYLLTHTSEQNHPVVQYHLGLCNEFGYGCTVNVTAAQQHYQRAADQGDLYAMLRMGVLCLKHRNPANDAAACTMLCQVANSALSLPPASRGELYHNLGLCFEHGYGCRKDLKRAKSYYDKAEALGYYTTNPSKKPKRLWWF